MKRFFFIGLIFVCLIISVSAQSSAGEDVLNLRRKRDEQFRTFGVSPLRGEDFADFKSLNYFPIEENFRVKAVFTESADKKIFNLPTSSGSFHKYMKVGDLKFEIGGKEFALSAYQRYFEPANARTQINTDLFVPFKDETNGTLTYSGGRYVYLRMPKDGTAVLDFNLTVNPACAYGDSSFSCPIPPKENFLETEIKAGEKIYKNYGKTAVD